MKRSMTVALVAVLNIAMLGLLVVASGPAKRAAKRALGHWNSRNRFKMKVVERPFTHLAASQVGYGPSMSKEFTSARSFDGFRITSERDGATVFAGAGPVRKVRTNLLGPIDTVFVGDFSPLRTPGRYRVVADNGDTSFPFEIGQGVFDPALRAIQRWFYYQRAFTEIDAAHAEGPWVHPSDADKAPPGVRKGWHDAGDFTVYSASLNTALFWLLEAFSDFKPAADDTGIPESGNGVPDLLDEARWGLEWLLSVQDASGGFRNVTCQDQYGAYGTNSPQSVPPYKDGEVGTLATARAVGNLAYASTVFRAYDAAFADRCLLSAMNGYRYLKERWSENTDGPSCPAYNANENAEVGRHARMFAAAGMLLASGEKQFRDDFENSFVDVHYDPSYNHMNGFAARLYLRAQAGDPARKRALRERVRLLAVSSREDGAKNPFGWATRFHWGSIGAGFTRTGFANVAVCLEDPARNAADCDQALANVHYVFGRNSIQFSYVSGLPGVTRGRTRAFHHWLATLRAKPFNFPGMVAGGPIPAPAPNDGSKPDSWPIPIWGYWGDPALPRDGSTPLDGRYSDNDSWSTNEVSVDWQGSALYSLYFAQWAARR